MVKREIITIREIQRVLRGVLQEELKEGGVLYDKSTDFAFKTTITYNDLLCNVTFSSVDNKLVFNLSTDKDILEFIYDKASNSSTVSLKSSNPNVLIEYEQLYPAIMQYVSDDFRYDCIEML